MPCFDPSTGAVIALAPQCTADEVEEAIQAAAKAFPAWRDTPVSKRVQVLFRMKALLDSHLDELTYLCAQENGKKWDEAQGDILKVIEVVEFATGAPHIMKGDLLANVSPGYDTVRFNEPIGVFAGIAPWNFPAMIPQGWMAPICIVTGNTLVLKAASFAPQCALRITELWYEAGLPAGVLNVITTSRNEAEIFLKHPKIRGVSFVGSTSVGMHIYSTAAANGKRVQALTEAKNHALVLSDCVLDRTVASIVNSFSGCAGERCMALPCVVVENAIADAFVEAIVKACKDVNLGPAYNKATGLGPVVNQGHKDFVLNWIETGVKEGATLVLDGRKPKVPRGCEKGFFVGPTIFDHVDRRDVGRPRGNLRPGAVRQAGRQFRGRPGDDERQPLRQRLGDLYRKRPLRARIRLSHRRRHGRRQCRHPGSARHLRLHRPQAVVLRRPALHGPRRLHLLHREQERHHDLVHRQGGAGQAEHLGRHHDALRRGFGDACRPAIGPRRRSSATAGFGADHSDAEGEGLRQAPREAARSD